MNPKHTRKNILSITVAGTILIVGLGLLVYSAWRFIPRYVATHDSHPTIAKEVITKAINSPGETSLKDACANYKVEPQYPERLAIPAVGASGCIERVGSDENGAMAVPSSIYTAGWYVESAFPGQPGLSIIDGHISGYYNVDGIFQGLHLVSRGDTLSITLGSGKELYYEVTKVQSVPLADAGRVLMSHDPSIKSQLNLITCGGSYNEDTKLYDERIIVTAKLTS